MTVLVDTSAVYACLDGRDIHHPSARRAFGDLAGAGVLLTHSYIVSEIAALVQARLGREPLRALFDDLLPAVETVFVDESVHQAAVAALIASGRRHASLVDWTSFELMRRLGIERAFAFDEDFAAQGFTLVPAPV